MLYTINGNNWHSSFQEAQNVISREDGQRPIAISHLSDSSDLNIHNLS